MDELTRNGVELSGDVIFACSLGLRNQELKPYFHGRTFYVYSPNEKDQDKRLYELKY